MPFGTSITVYERAGKPNVPWPVSCTIPLTRGKYRQAPRVSIVDDTGNVVPSKVKPLSYWWEDSDRSIRFLEINFICDGLPAKGNRVFKIEESNSLWVTQNNNPIKWPTVELNGIVPTFTEPTFQLQCNEDDLFRRRILSEVVPGDIPGMRAVTTQWAGIEWGQLDLVLLNNRFDQRKGNPFQVNNWTLRHPHLEVYQKKYVPVRSTAEGDGLDLLWNFILHDMSGFRRRVLVGTKADADRDATFLAPPVAVADAKIFIDTGHAAWPFDRFPSKPARSVTPVMFNNPPLELRNPEYFLVIDKVRAEDPNHVGGWPYADAEFFATGDPAAWERCWDNANAGAWRLPQAVNGYNHNKHWGIVGLDPGPNGGGSLRDATLGANTLNRLKASDGQHCWLDYILGAYWVHADPLLGDWIVGMAQARIAEIRGITKWPDDSERAMAHNFCRVLHGWILDGDPACMDAMRFFVRKLRTYKNRSVQYGMWFTSFKTPMLIRALIGFMQEIGPDDKDYWECYQYITASVQQNLKYGNFCYQASTADILVNKPASDATSLTWPDPLAWYIENFGGRDLWLHLSDYIGAKIGKGPYVKGAEWVNWKGAYEGRYYIDASKRSASWTFPLTPTLNVVDRGDGALDLNIELPAEAIKWLVLKSSRPVSVEYTTGPITEATNHFSCQIVAGGGGNVVPKLLVEQNNTGKPWHFAVLCWNGARARGYITYSPAVNVDPVPVPPVVVETPPVINEPPVTQDPVIDDPEIITINPPEEVVITGTSDGSSSAQGSGAFDIVDLSAEPPAENRVPTRINLNGDVYYDAMLTYYEINFILTSFFKNEILYLKDTENNVIALRYSSIQSIEDRSKTSKLVGIG